MPSALNIQSDRNIRYVQRMDRKRVEQQKIDRTIRFSNRNKDISFDDSNEITSLSRKPISVNNEMDASYFFW